MRSDVIAPLRHRIACLSGCLAALACGFMGRLQAAAPPVELLRQHCGACHCDGGAEGGIDLDALLIGAEAGSPAEGSTEQAHWVAVWRNLQAETMPPADADQPTPAERQSLVSLVLGNVLDVDPDHPDPGRVVLRRLNRVEYGNTIRDLTSFAENVTDDLPPDDTGYGFDTIGDVLSLSPLLLEKYLDTAGRVAEQVVAEATAGRTATGYEGTVSQLFTQGLPPQELEARPAHRRSTIRSIADRAFRRPVDDTVLDRLTGLAEAVETSVGGSFEAGVGAALTAILASPRFLFRVEESDSGRLPSDQARLPVSPDSAVPIDDYSLATRLSYFLWSTMPDDELFRVAREGRLRQELHSQVERMVADSRSDDFVANFVGQWLQTRDVESKAVDLEGLYRGHGRGRWRLVRMFDWDVREAMRRETELLFAHVLRERLPATDLLLTNQSFLNEPLARFYGIPKVKGNQMRLVDLPADSGRSGLLTHGSLLLVTSNPNRTSPVKRGLFILDNLLAAPPPPPPPSVPPLEQAAASAGESATMRELMERHRSDPGCAACHKRMDPLGLALEGYDAVGRFRSGAEGQGIDTSGRLMTGEEFADPAELAALIAGPRRQDFHRCLAEKMLTYAIGRGQEYSDAPAVAIILESLQADGRLVDVVHGVVSSVPFQMRRTSDFPPVASLPSAEIKP